MRTIFGPALKEPITDDRQRTLRSGRVFKFDITVVDLARMEEEVALIMQKAAGHGYYMAQLGDIEAADYDQSARPLTWRVPVEATEYKP